MNELELNILRQDLNLMRRLVSRRTILDKRDYGRCPFHDEETSSFHIYNGLDRARYHCFGCEADGDIFNYLQRAEKLSFNVAVMRLRFLIRNPGHNLSSFPPRGYPESASTTQVSPPLDPTDTYINCQLNCQYYQNLEEMYRKVWEENQKFRVWLNLGNYHPSIKHKMEEIYREEE